MDMEGQRLEGLVGPYDEDSNVLLICEAEGGLSQILIMIIKSMSSEFVSDRANREYVLREHIGLGFWLHCQMLCSVYVLLECDG